MKTKQLALLLLVLALPLGAWCQLEKGSWLGSATAGFAFSTNKDLSNGSSEKSSNLDFSINSGFGIFVINKLVIGPGFSINTGYYSEHNDNGTNGENKYSETSYSILLQPFVRYYFYSSGKIALFGQVSGKIGYGQQFETFINGSLPKDKATINDLVYGGGLAAGFVYFINPNIGVETSLGYQFGGQQTKETDYFDKSRNGELALNAGLSFYLGKCKKEEKKEKKD
jgi:hypothetical protein